MLRAEAGIPHNFVKGSANFNYCQLWLSVTFLTRELCTKTGVNKLLFPPLWLQPNPRQKFPPAQFPVLVGREHDGEGRGTFKSSSSVVFTCRDWIFLTIPALRGKTPASLMGGWSWPSQGLSLPVPRGCPPTSAAFACASPTFTSRRGVMSLLLLERKQKHPETTV